MLYTLRLSLLHAHDVERRVVGVRGTALTDSSHINEWRGMDFYGARLY